MWRSPNKLFGDTRGVASLELAIVIPIMLMLLIGVYQLTQLVRVNARLSRTAVSVADLVAQQSNGVTGGQSGSLGNFCAAAGLMMGPFPTTSTTFMLSIASVTNYSPSNIQVDWEVDTACSNTGTHLGANAVTLVTSPPVNLLSTSGPSGSTGIAGDTVIVVQASYQYTSLLKFVAPALTTLTKTGFARPRADAVVPCTASCT